MISLIIGKQLSVANLKNLSLFSSLDSSSSSSSFGFQMILYCRVLIIINMSFLLICRNSNTLGFELQNEWKNLWSSSSLESLSSKGGATALNDVLVYTKHSSNISSRPWIESTRSSALVPSSLIFWTEMIVLRRAFLVSSTISLAFAFRSMNSWLSLNSSLQESSNLNLVEDYWSTC